MGRGSRNQASSATGLLYGRRPRRGAGPVSAPPAPPRLEGVLTDQEMLDNGDLFPLYDGSFPRSGEEINLLASTPTLIAGPTNKEYYGAVGVVREPDGSKSFIGWTNFGPSGRGRAQGKVEYRGDDFNGALSAVNVKLSKKQSAKARSVYAAPGGPHFLSREAITLP